MRYHAQQSLDLPLRESLESSAAIRRANNEADQKTAIIRGLVASIAFFQDALKNNTYPCVGRGKPLMAEDRPRYEAQVAAWKAELAGIMVP